MTIRMISDSSSFPHGPGDCFRKDRHCFSVDKTGNSLCFDNAFLLHWTRNLVNC